MNSVSRPTLQSVENVSAQLRINLKTYGLMGKTEKGQQEGGGRLYSQLSEERFVAGKIAETT
jgi:hypothetical protein